MGSLTDAPDLDTRSGRKDFYFNLMHRVVGEVVPTQKWNPKGHKINIDNNAISLVATEGGVEAILAGGKREVFKEYSGLKEFVKRHMKDSAIFDETAAEWKKIVSDLERDGFEYGTDYMGINNELHFGSEAARKRAEGLIETRLIARTYGKVIVLKDSLSAFQNAISILESDGFERGVDFTYFEGVLKFTSRARCDRAASLLPTKDIKARGFDYIYLNDSAVVTDAISKGATVGVPLKNSGTARATVVSVSGGMATVRITEGEHKGLEMDVATSILKDKAIIYAPVVDAATDYVINWNDTYHGTHEKTTVKAKSIKEALEKFKVMVALGGVGWANVYVVNVSPNDGYVRNYGKLNELIKTVSDSATVSELDLDNLPSEDGEQKVKLHTGGKVIEVEVESEEHEREERLGDSAFSDAVDLKKLADLINKAADKAEGNTISKSGVYATAEKDHISVSCANSNDVSQVARIVKGLIAVNSEANKTLRVSTSSHEVYVEFKDSRKAFTVKDKKGRELLVFAADSDEAVKKVRALKDAAFTVTARTNDFPYGNNLATIVDANSEQEAVAKYRKVLEARGDKINSISARPTTASDEARGITRLRDSDLMDGHETELKLLAPLGTIVQKWKAWKNKYKVLAELEEKYWRNWDGYSTSLARNEPEKYKRLTENLKKANSEVQPIINEWNRIAESVDRGIFGGNGKIPKLSPETFPESHLFYYNLEEVFENVKRRINYQKK